MLLYRSNDGRVDLGVRGQIGNEIIPCLTFYLAQKVIDSGLVRNFKGDV
jgi:hypothetical protein